MDFGSGARLDQVVIRITQADGTPTNERWSTADANSYPLVLWKDNPAGTGTQVNNAYIASPFDNTNALGTYTGQVTFYAYGQIFKPAQPNLGQQFKIELSLAESIPNPGDTADTLQLTAYVDSINDHDACAAPVVVIRSCDSSCESASPTTTDGGTQVGFTILSATATPPDPSDVFLYDQFILCPEVPYIVYTLGVELVECEDYVIYWPDGVGGINSLAFRARRGTIIEACPDHSGTFYVEDPGYPCADELATQETIVSSGLQAVPVCGSFGSIGDFSTAEPGGCSPFAAELGQFATVGDVSQQNTEYFAGGASFNPGTYYVEYVEGAYNFSSPANAWTVHGIEVSYNNGAAATGGFDTYAGANQADAEANFACAHWVFEHTGGKIGLVFNDSYFADNVLGTPGPTFRIIAI